MTRYQRYLRSKHWRRRRAAFRKTHAYRCPCGATEKLQLHHKTYERLGAELDQDLMWLCQRCHTLVEQLVDEGQLDRACDGFFDRERAVRTPSAPSVEPQRERHAQIVRAVEKARKAAKRAGDYQRVQRIEKLSQKYGVRH